MGWATIDQAVVSASNLLTSLLLVRQMGIDSYGYYVLVWSLVQQASSVILAFVSTPMMNRVPAMPDTERIGYLAATLRMALALVAVFALGSALMQAVVDVYGRPAMTAVERLALPLTGTVFLVFDFLRRQAYARNRPRVPVLMDVIGYGLQLPLMFAWSIGQPLTWTSALWIVAACHALGMLPVARWLSTPDDAKASVREEAVIHARTSGWNVGSAVFAWINGNSMTIALATVLGPAAVGTVRACLNMLAALNVLILAAQNALPQAASLAYAASGAEGLRRFLVSVSLRGVLAVAAVAAVILPFDAFWVGLVYGRQFPQQGWIIGCFAVSYAFSVLCTVTSLCLNVVGHASAGFLATVLGAAVAALFAQPLVARFGVDGFLAGMLLLNALTFVILLTSLARQLSDRGDRSRPSGATTL